MERYLAQHTCLMMSEKEGARCCSRLAWALVTLVVNLRAEFGKVTRDEGCRCSSLVAKGFRFGWMGACRFQ